MDRFLSPSETARRFGVTTKALRLYERHGLIAPVRSASGWRTYGPAQVTRLVQILALKRLGLPLARIAELLAGRDDLGAVLALQEDVLSRESQRLARALAVVRDARRRLASGAVLSIDDLATLAKETVMTTEPDVKEMAKLLKPFSDRYFSEAEKEAMRSKAIDRNETIQNWDDLIAEGERLMQSGVDPTTPSAQNLAHRWSAMSEAFVGGDTTIPERARAMWNAAMEDPAVAAQLAHKRTIFVYVKKAVEHYKKMAGK
jgi:DNA-binding transcriptional MerR regulator